MSEKSGPRLATLAGFALVALGVWLVAEKVLGPLLWPLKAALQVLAGIGWPIVLVVAGVLLLTRGRAGSGSGGSASTSAGTEYPAAAGTSRRLYRSRTNRVIGGVVAGAADYLGISARVARISFVVLTLITSVWFGVFVYLLALALVPEAPLTSTAPAPPVPGPAPARPAPAPPTA